MIGRADNGKDAIDMIKDTEPDVVLLGSGNATGGWYYCG